MLSRALRVSASRDFAVIYRQGKQLSSAHLRLFSLSKNQNPSRFGFVVSKKHAAKIVARNRLKRILRSAVRALADRVLPGFDIVVQAKAGAAGAASGEIRQELAVLLGQAKILKP